MSTTGLADSRTRASRRRTPTRRAWLLAVAILLLAFNLRPAVTSLGAVLGEARQALGLSPALAGVLTTLPVLCFAAMGALAATLAKRFGIQAVLLASLVAVVVGEVARALTGASVLFVLATIVSLAGMATGNVLIPAGVRAYFPNRVGLATAAYTTMLAIGTTVPAAVTVPIGHAAGSWRYGIGIWALTAAVAAVPWLILVVTSRETRPVDAVRRPGAARPMTFRQLARSPVAWALACYFGLQSTQAYAMFGWLAQIFRDAGVDPVQAGVLLSIIPIAGVPMSLAIPTIAARVPNPWALVALCGACYVVGYAGLWLAPTAGSYAWAILIGLGGGAFPLALTMIGMRARRPENTAALSGFTQSIGYLLSAAGPLAIGALYGATGGWTVPIGLLLALLVPQVIAGVLAARHRYVEDALPASDAGTGDPGH